MDAKAEEKGGTEEVVHKSQIQKLERRVTGKK